MQFSSKNFYFILLLILFVSCKQNSPSPGQENQETSTKIDISQYMEEGDVLLPEEPADNFRPTLPLDQAAFKTETGDMERLTNEFEFIFDKTWIVNGRIKAGDKAISRPDNESYTFDRNGTYSYTKDGKNNSGTWKGRMMGNLPTITLFSFDLNEKVSEWNIRNVGSTMLWVGTPSYKDNPYQIQFRN